MKILNAGQIRALDAHTIQHEPIASIDLMERASTQFTKWFVEKFPDREHPILVFAGTGNNGGDGMAVARLLSNDFYDVTTYICRFSKGFSDDCATNYQRLEHYKNAGIREINKGDEFPEIPGDAVIIDAIFGSGLNRPVTGYWAELINHLNASPAPIASIDIPSGLFADKPTDSACIEADYTVSFELPKLAFLFPENQDKVGKWTTTSIGLSKDFLDKTHTDNYYLTPEMIRPHLKKRHKFDHKGTFGHALLFVGGFGKMGAAILSSRACLRTGAGLVTMHIPKAGYEIAQISVPEAMVSVDVHRYVFSKLPDLEPYDAIGTGCGIGTNAMTVKALKKLLQTVKVPLVIDADGLNILSENKTLLKKLPRNTILTPHPKEFERLFGTIENGFVRYELQREKAQELGIIIVLKGANTGIALPDGRYFFNSTGNPGMATAGSGDVLTGIITGLLAQGYAPEYAAITGVFLHGLAGDVAAEKLGHEAIIAGDIIKYFGTAFCSLKKNSF